ncbi:CDP-archaeol synthase [Neoroseomonas soli]|uniref:CDP-archaeol synthase n=1 Tax=Neoroseomonas soli TaxID=1081025 RepID=UPI001BA59690|nr:CDP-archaeol synthase [Neoroseomonas soli]
MAIIDPILVLRVLLLLSVANGAPVVTGWLLGRWRDAPLDRGGAWRDGRPLFGTSKTIRGIAAALACTSAVAPVLGFEMATGFLAAAAAMAGDLFSSFVKRRLGLAPHAEAPGIDQVPEALLPMLLLRSALGLSVPDILVVLVAFTILDLVLSRLLSLIGASGRPR